MIAVSQSSQKCLIYEDCDYDQSQSSKNDRSPPSLHKMIAVYFWGLWSGLQSTQYAVFMSTATMIAFLTKILFFWVFIGLWPEDRDHDRSIHKISYIWVFMKIVIMSTVLKKDRDWSQSSQNALFLSSCEDFAHGRNPHKNSKIEHFVRTTTDLGLRLQSHFWQKVLFLSQSSQTTTITSHNIHCSIAIISRPLFRFKYK